ncbi:hypothetical protein POM88_006468 [Heracleum sosnowskyi]|uniref:NB-ARC domain-containing protein n=1 Tax=Heracleum sosnowskyi TaxID=360622 RepID=A0AAD8J2S0_9APIA|nr:hypothetical protein POM88_006468 [Heracleum sosnowskyi]
MFPKRMWVTVSDDFDFMKILNQMVGSLTSTSSVLDNAEALIKKLQIHLEGVKFLLVLDDVWNAKAEKWDNLMNSLLGKEDNWALFKQRGFLHGGISETWAFVASGRRMVERCGGLPLAIKTLGGSLYSKKSEEEWLLIQNSEVWKSKGVLSSLRFSYDNLPYSSLKRCFACCSIIPKDSPIYKDELVQIWMALGFLLPPRDSNAQMEDVGNGYFNILLSHSLLQDVERDEYGNIAYCKMHDLALDVSTHCSITVTPSQDSNHLSKAIYVTPEGFQDLKPNIYGAYFDTTLRVSALHELPKKVCNLINLRHLVIEDKYADSNPRRRCMFIGITRLICLQTLPHFVLSRDRNCLVGQLGGLKNLRDKREDRESNDEDVMKGLEPHAYLKELTIDNFMGKKFASWITMMANLVKITLRCCNRCEEFPQLGHLPKLREMKIVVMDNVNVIGNDIYGGQYSSSNDLSDSGGASSCFPSLNELGITNLDSSMIIETMSRKIRSHDNCFSEVL